MHLEKENGDLVMKFIEKYNSEQIMVNKLGFMYDLVDDSFAINQETGLMSVRTLIKLVSHKKYNLSEIKTALIISKGLRDHEMIHDVRKQLLTIYQTKKSITNKSKT